MSVTEVEYAQILRNVTARATPRPFPASRPVATEAEEQEALIAWARLYKRTYPALAILAHIPNGGKRDKAEARKFQRLGVLPGMPDLILLYPARNYHGWAGEMKSATGSLSPAQARVLSQLRLYGYFAATFHGWEQARDSLVWYLTG